MHFCGPVTISYNIDVIAIMANKKVQSFEFCYSKDNFSLRKIFRVCLDWFSMIYLCIYLVYVCRLKNPQSDYVYQHISFWAKYCNISPHLALSTL